MSKRIYIIGASGAGVSTLGAALAFRLQAPHFDVDDYYWYPTDPPFEQPRSATDRIALLKTDLAVGQWALSGSLDGWGDELIQDADLVVFIDTPTEVRIERLKARESQRYGERILPGGDPSTLPGSVPRSGDVRQATTSDLSSDQPDSGPRCRHKRRSTSHQDRQTPPGTSPSDSEAMDTSGAAASR